MSGKERANLEWEQDKEKYRVAEGVEKLRTIAWSHVDGQDSGPVPRIYPSRRTTLTAVSFLRSVTSQTDLKRNIFERPRTNRACAAVVVSPARCL